MGLNQETPQDLLWVGETSHFRGKTYLGTPLAFYPYTEKDGIRGQITEKNGTSTMGVDEYGVEGELGVMDEYRGKEPQKRTSMK